MIYISKQGTFPSTQALIHQTIKARLNCILQLPLHLMLLPTNYFCKIIAQYLLAARGEGTKVFQPYMADLMQVMVDLMLHYHRIYNSIKVKEGMIWIHMMRIWNKTSLEILQCPHRMLSEGVEGELFFLHLGISHLIMDRLWVMHKVSGSILLQ